jgi:hypothetical protein
LDDAEARGTIVAKGGGVGCCGVDAAAAARTGEARWEASGVWLRWGLIAARDDDEDDDDEHGPGARGRSIALVMRQLRARVD